MSAVAGAAAAAVLSNARRGRPEALPLPIRLIEPLKEQLMRLKVLPRDQKDFGSIEDVVCEAGYRNSIQIAALLDTTSTIFATRTYLHPIVAKAVSELEQNEVTRDLLDDNEWAMVAGKGGMKKAGLFGLLSLGCWGAMVGSITLDSLPDWLNLSIMLTFGFAGVGTGLVAAVGPPAVQESADNASYLLVDRIYELLSQSGAQEQLANKLSYQPTPR